MSKILIVDDNPDERRIIETALYYNGFETVEAATGMEAIRVARESSPDLIIMDVKLPDMSGLLAVEIMRTEPTLVNTPVICITGLDLSADAALSRGCKDLILKPILPADIVTVVRRHTEAPPVP